MNDSESLIIDLSPSSDLFTGRQTTLHDEELLDQYLTATYLTISSKTPIQHVYRFDMPEQALTHAHLMHAMLAISAAHLMHIRPDRRDLYEKKARRHQHLGKQLPLRASAICCYITINESNSYVSPVIFNCRSCRH